MEKSSLRAASYAVKSQMVIGGSESARHEYEQERVSGVSHCGMGHTGIGHVR